MLEIITYQGDTHLVYMEHNTVIAKADPIKLMREVLHPEAYAFSYNERDKDGNYNIISMRTEDIKTYSILAITKERLEALRNEPRTV